jgi:DNA-binding NarL/FixJ family response regulator
MPTKTKILLVDDHPLVREWLAKLIDEEPDLEVCGQAGDAREAISLLGRVQPRIVFVDISLDGGSGLELVKDIKSIHPSAEVIILSMHVEMLYAERVMRSGAAGYIMKREATDQVFTAIRAVLKGELFFSHAVNAMLAQKLTQRSTDKPATIDGLSDRELEVFQLLGRGQTPRQISEKLNVSFKTVHVYCSRIREKLDLSTLNELVFQAIRWQESQRPQ